jgi:RNA polymerase sigma-70 factor, ECF subfamily
VRDTDGLLERVREGDLGSFEALYDQFSRLVYAVAYRVLQSEAGADDVTQNVFLKIWLAPGAFRGGNFAGWLAQIARNSAIDLLRKTARERELPATFSSDGEVDELVLTRVDADHARRLIADLRSDQRRAIELAYFDGLTYAEIAERTGAPLGTVKTRIRTGLRSLRAALTEGVPT